MQRPFTVLAKNWLRILRREKRWEGLDEIELRVFFPFPRA
jgi:hypothetical protein